MKIAGIQKLTLVDFPGHVAATLFTQGCSFRCGFCHNPELVLPEKFEGLLLEGEVFEFLEARYGKLTGICLTGGEPLLQPDAGKFISHMKALGFDVKLDTNGSFPDRLEQIIKDGDVDYIAMDIKNSLNKYVQTISSQKSKVKSQKNCHSGLDPESRLLIKSIQRSIQLIISSGIDYEFRTTVCHPYHEVADFEDIGKLIQGAKRYFIQNYQDSKRINESIEYSAFTDKELNEANKIMKKYVKESEVR
ncbi:MAG: anaerobic ribonucleoside-triphosphate reductase activating protein [Patescibacteria group bacterium]|jgi:pyruvate formate lyase activating enzyme